MHGLGGSALQVFRRKIIHHIFSEFLLEIHNIVRNIQLFGNPPGIVHSAQATAASVFFPGFLRLILPDLHGDADDLITLFFQQKGSHGGIHASGHAHNYFFAHILVFFLCFFFSFVNIGLGFFQSFNGNAVLLGIVPERRMDGLLCEQGAVYLYGAEGRPAPP